MKPLAPGLDPGGGRRLHAWTTPASYGFGGPASVPVAADYEGDGKLDFALFTPDASGGMQYVYQQSQAGPGIVVDFATSTDIAPTSPSYLRARKVRG